MKKTADLLKFRTPANWWGEKWREGLYSGNGRIGANVYGGAVDERILLNDSALNWHGRINVVPDISTKIKDVRKRIENGDFKGAQSVLPQALEQKNFRPQPFATLPLCCLSVDFRTNSVANEFSRVLDMADGEISVGFKSADTRYTRDLFVSRDNNLIVYRINKQGSLPINLEMYFSLMHRVNSRTYEGTCSMPEGDECKTDKQFLLFAARNDDDGTDFGAVAKVSINGGSIRCENDTMRVNGANSVFVLIATFVGGNRDKEWSTLKAKLSNIKDGYDKMLKAHASLHAKRYGSVDVELTDEDDKYIEELISDANTGNLSPLLAEKLYRYGRYLFVSGTSGDGEQLSPVGLWNGSYKPYRALKCNSGEIEMTYLHALAGDLEFDLEKTFARYEANLGDYQNNAMRLFGCHGIMVPAVSAPNTGRLGSTDVFAVHFTGCAGWLCNFYYKSAKRTQNAKFVKMHLLPFMKEAAVFYEEFFRPDSEGVLTSAPSALPMRIGDAVKITDRPVVAKNSALDFAVARDFFANLIEASEEYGVYKSEIPVWKEFAAKIPSQQLSGDGIYKEFVNSVISVDYTGISVGTLYPAYFGNEVDFLSDEETLENYSRTADKKMSEPALQHSYNMSVLASVYARLGDGYKARQCIANVIHGCAMNNLILVDKDWRGMGVCGSGVWTPVQLQSNLVITNAVQEMLMYSSGNVIYVFPALPSEWKNASFSGLMAENGAEVSVSVDAGRSLMLVTLYSKKDARADLYLPSGVKKLLKTNNAADKLSDGTFKCVKNIKLDANKSAVYSFKYTVK